MVGGYQILDFSDLPPIQWNMTSKTDPNINVVGGNNPQSIPTGKTILNGKDIIVKYAERICEFYDNKLKNKPILVQGLQFAPNWKIDGEKPIFEGKILPFFVESFKKIHDYGDDNDNYRLYCEANISLGDTSRLGQQNRGYNLYYISVNRYKKKDEDGNDYYDGIYNLYIYLTGIEEN